MVQYFSSMAIHAHGVPSYDTPPARPAAGADFARVGPVLRTPAYGKHWHFITRPDPSIPSVGCSGSPRAEVSRGASGRRAFASLWSSDCAFGKRTQYV